MKVKFKTTALALTLTALGGMIYAQSTTPQPGVTPGTNRGNSSSPQATAVMNPATELVEMNTAELALARTASGKAQSPAVKAFAEMMVKDHSAALTKLQDVQGAPSTAMKISDKHQSTADRLAKLSGAEFDREYMATMVTAHQETLDFLEQQSKLTKANPDPTPGAGKAPLARVASEMIPTVRVHLQQAQKIQQEVTGNAQPALGTNTNTGARDGNATTNTNGTTNNSRGNSSAPPATGNPAGGNR